RFSIVGEDRRGMRPPLRDRNHRGEEDNDYREEKHQTSQRFRPVPFFYGKSRWQYGEYGCQKQPARIGHGKPPRFFSASLGIWLTAIRSSPRSRIRLRIPCTVAWSMTPAIVVAPSGWCEMSRSPKWRIQCGSRCPRIRNSYFGFVVI